MIVLNATLKAVEGRGDDLEREFRKLVPLVRKDKGTMTYIVHRGINDASQFFVYEKYENDEALKLHGSTPHFKQFREAIAGMIDGRPVTARYVPLD